MDWIKRNVVFVIGAAIGVLLLGAAIFFLLKQMQEDSDVTGELEAQTASISSLTGSSPFPSDTNVALAKGDFDRMAAIIEKSKAQLAPVAARETTADLRQFLALLENEITAIQEHATNAGVFIPANYGFSFGHLRNKPTLRPETFEPWITQLNEIKVICRVLFDARVNGIESVRRVPISRDDNGPDLLSGSVIGTNSFGIFTPYEIVFRGFSVEMEQVLEGFQRVTNCFIVKSVNVDQSRWTPPQQPASISSPVIPGVQPRYLPPQAEKPASQILAERYGIRPGGGAAPPVQAPIFVPRPSNTPLPPQTALSERPLRVNLLVEVVKLRPDKK